MAALPPPPYHLAPLEYPRAPFTPPGLPGHVPNDLPPPNPQGALALVPRTVGHVGPVPAPPP